MKVFTSVDELFDYIRGGLKETEKDVNKQLQNIMRKKENKIKQLKREASRYVSLANKRLKRLESNGLKTSPAYQLYLKEGGEKFSVKGKNYNQLVSEIARLRNFINAKTSTVRGANNYLKDIAKITGIDYSSLKDLRMKSANFFRVADMVEQYLRTSYDMASAIGYQKIWESINQYVKDNQIDLANAEKDIEKVSAEISKAIGEYNSPEQIKLRFKGKYIGETWVKLPK